MVSVDSKRVLRHLLGGPWQVHRVFGRDGLRRIEQAIAGSERLHAGELRFVVEAVLPWQLALRGVSARARAVQLFSELRVWDTEHNSGVLVYLLLADRDVEIVADRGIDHAAGRVAWEPICREMEANFRAGRYDSGAMQAIARIGALLQQHFPVEHRTRPNELPDTPVVI